ncbi:MAG: AraC family transcriptional regulator [Planctomycetota bacterium]
MRATTRAAHEERIQRAVLFLHERLDEELSLDRLAEVAGYSRYHFHRLFRGLVGESLGEHRRRLRLERAAVRLRRGSRPVIDEALDAGYESHEAFTRAFRARFGCSPSDWRAGGVHEPAEPGATALPFPGGVGDVRVVERPEVRVLSARHVGPYEEVGNAWQALMVFAAPRGLLAGGPESLGICHDDPSVTAAEHLRYDACLCVDAEVDPASPLTVRTLPASRYALAEHTGSYEGLGVVHDWLCGAWLPDAGLWPADRPCVEVYRNNPTNTPPERLRTDVLLPLQP